MSEHLELPHLKSFAARLHLAMHLGSQALSDDGQDMINNLATQADQLARYQDEDLEAAFQSLRDSIASEKRRLGSSLSADLSNRLARLNEALEACSCRWCPANGLARCAFGSKTHASVEMGGQCIDPVKRLSAGILKWVNEMWRGLPGASVDPEIVLATTHAAFTDNRYILKEFSISGWARTARTKHPTTTIGIELREKSFEWTQYCLLPYVLLHEVLCHGFQDLDLGRDKTLPRWDANSDSAWSEGWMDRLAYRLALDWHKQQGEAYGIRTASQRDHASARTYDLHQARYPSTKAAVGRTHGRNVFDKIHESYGRATRDSPFAEQKLTKFSIRLNARNIPDMRDVPALDRERLKIINGLDALAMTSIPDLHAVMDRFTETGDLDGLRRELA